ncbi:mitotic apparatus protein p62-like [Oratosquilla oratoria]|uniref:mitotic apparatus protein p62-like n=1 Tax=Oratosquilla oratoria TaxID=337810 RepID=UPI003F76FF0A
MRSGALEKSHFWAVTLDSDHKEYKWEGTATENTEDGTVTTHTLYVRQAVLSPDAKDEANVVEVECVGYNDKKYKSPVCVMTTGSSYNSVLEILLEDQEATFRLTRGSGPLTLIGSHQTEMTLLGEDGLDEEEEEDGADDEELDEEEVPPKKKAKI